MEPGPHLDRLNDALRADAEAQRRALAGDEAGARQAFADAAAAYWASWGLAPPASYGRLVGMVKAGILSGDASAAADRARAALADAPASPTAAWALALAALALGDDADAARAAEDMRSGDAAFGRAADAVTALAAEDRAGYDAAIEAIVADFGGRSAHLTGVPIADTALVLERLAESRGMARRPASPLLPAAT
jgi:hypothetical protein